MNRASTTPLNMTIDVNQRLQTGRSTNSVRSKAARPKTAGKFGKCICKYLDASRCIDSYNRRIGREQGSLYVGGHQCPEFRYGYLLPDRSGRFSDVRPDHSRSVSS